MRLDKASNTAVKFACENFHYAKKVPAGASISFACFNNNGDWCGIIMFGYPPSPAIANQYGVNNGEIYELRRVALDGRQELTSAYVSLAIRLFKKRQPLCKLLVSWADSAQEHVGTIYQATNWYYCGSNSTGTEYFHKGEWRHGKAKAGWGIDFTKLPKRKSSQKHRYIYPLHKSLIPLCKSLAKPYPKKQNAAVAHTGEHLASSQKGAFDSTLPLNETAE
jgi:hypothetical protein